MSQDGSWSTYLEIRIESIIGPGRVDLIRHSREGDPQLIENFRGLGDKGEFENLKTALRNCFAEGDRCGLIDLSRMPWLNSSGIGKLVDLWKEFDAAGGALVLVGPNHRVSEVFRVTKLEKVFHIVGTREEAREFFGKRDDGKHI